METMLDLGQPSMNNANLTCSTELRKTVGSQGSISNSVISIPKFEFESEKLGSVPRPVADDGMSESETLSSSDPQLECQVDDDTEAMEDCTPKTRTRPWKRDIYDSPDIWHCSQCRRKFGYESCNQRVEELVQAYERLGIDLKVTQPSFQLVRQETCENCGRFTLCHLVIDPDDVSNCSEDAEWY